MEALTLKLKEPNLKRLHSKNKRTLNIVFVLFCAFGLHAQTFEHVENYIGLENVADNNGAAVADYDADGDLDLFVVAKAQDVDGVNKSASKLFSNNNDGTFTEVTQASGLVNLFPANEETCLYRCVKRV